jgi:hypothetical protein
VSNPPDPAGGGQLYGVSCTSPSFCVAVGGSGQAPIAEEWNGAAWATLAPVTPTDGDGSLSGVSCTSPTSCFAVGQTLLTGSETTEVLAEYWDGSTWTQENVAVPSADSSPFLESVDCVAAMSCVAVGGYGGAANVVQIGQALAEVWNGSTWTNETVPGPPGSENEGLASISCLSADSCEATGYTNTGYGSYSTALSAALTGSAWTTGAMDSPGIDAFPNAVSCTAVGNCEAVGGYETSSSATGNSVLAQNLSEDSWTQQPTPNPGTSSNELSGVSCPTTTQCIAVGDTSSTSGADSPLIEEFGS